MVWLKRLAIAAGLVALFLALDFALNEFLIEYVVRIVILCGIYAILAVGLNLINGTTGQFSIGHAGFMAVGAYACAVTVVSVDNAWGAGLAGLPPFLAHGLVLTIGLIVGGLFAGVAGFIVGVPSLRLRGDYLAIVTLGFGEIIRLLFNNAEALGGATGYSGGASRPLGLPTYTSVFWVFGWATLLILLMRNLTFSAQGRALLAIREDEIAAEAMGIPTTKMKVLAFVISSMSAGVAGGLFAHLQSTVRPDDFRFDRSIDMIAMIIIGGLGSITGAVVGAVLVAVSLELMRGLQEFRLIVYALVLIILMIVRPDGLLGRYELNPGRLFARIRAAKGERSP